jgi:hypothetical protein
VCVDILNIFNTVKIKNKPASAGFFGVVPVIQTEDYKCNLLLSFSNGNPLSMESSFLQYVCKYECRSSRVVLESSFEVNERDGSYRNNREKH